VISPAKAETLSGLLRERFGETLQDLIYDRGDVTAVLASADLLAVAAALRDEPAFSFKLLLDVSGVDYQTYGKADWTTHQATAGGFSRGVSKGVEDAENGAFPARFAVVYHLLSVQNNLRLRLKVFLPNVPSRLPTVSELWPSADWYEREAFDLFGILFEGHPDLRRLLTDYGFIGHPFRKDFPLEGYVEVRYDAEKQRVVYQPVSIENRTLVPRVIRNDVIKGH